MCVGLLARLIVRLHSHYKFVVNNSKCACKHASVYVYIMQNSLSSRPNLKKNHSQEATLKYQVLIWQIQATGVFTFQRLREKDQMLPLAAQQHPYRDHSHRHG